MKKKEKNKSSEKGRVKNPSLKNLKGGVNMVSKVQVSKVKFGVWQAIKEAGLSKKELILLKDLLKKLGNLYISNSTNNSKKIKELKEKILKYAKAKNIDIREAIKELHNFGFITDKEIEKLKNGNNNNNKYFINNLYLSYCLQIANVIVEYLYVKDSSIDTIEVIEKDKETKENRVIEVIKLNNTQQANKHANKKRKKQVEVENVDDDIELLNKIKDIEVEGEVTVEL